MQTDTVFTYQLLLSDFLGVNAVSWLGNLNFLAPVADFSEPPYGEEDNRTPFPVRPKEKRSYAQSCVVWIKSVGLQVCATLSTTTY